MDKRDVGPLSVTTIDVPWDADTAAPHDPGTHRVQRGRPPLPRPAHPQVPCPDLLAHLFAWRFINKLSLLTLAFFCSHVSPEFIEEFGQCLEQLRSVFLTEHGQPFLLAGSGEKHNSSQHSVLANSHVE